MNGNTEFDQFDDAVADASAKIHAALNAAANEANEQLAILYLQADELRRAA